MNILKLMNENNIDINMLFTLGKFNGKEGLIFFEVSNMTEEVNGVEEEFQTIEAQNCIIDGANFILKNIENPELELDSRKDNVYFYRVDGLEIVIPSSDFKEMPYKIIELSNKIHTTTPPANHIEVE